MTLPLSANLPLRTSAVWGEFGEVAVIPHRYGRTRGAALRYDNSGRRFVWADQPAIASPGSGSMVGHRAPGPGATPRT